MWPPTILHDFLLCYWKFTQFKFLPIVFDLATIYLELSLAELYSGGDLPNCAGDCCWPPAWPAAIEMEKSPVFGRCIFGKIWQCGPQPDSVKDWQKSPGPLHSQDGQRACSCHANSNLQMGCVASLRRLGNHQVLRILFKLCKVR